MACRHVPVLRKPHLASCAATALPGLGDNVGRPLAKCGIQPFAVVDLGLDQRRPRFKRTRIFAHEFLKLRR